MLPRLRQRYENRGRDGRSRMIDELVEQFGYSRKHAIKLLGAKAGWGGDPLVRKGRPAVYGEDAAEVFWRIWQVAEQPCGKRLAGMRTLWLPHYEARYAGDLPIVAYNLSFDWDRALQPEYSRLQLPTRAFRCGKSIA